MVGSWERSNFGDDALHNVECSEAHVIEHKK